MNPAAETWLADTIRLARRLPAAVAPGILADRYLERLGWDQNADPDVPWIVFDGPSAVGKDTQIALAATVLRGRGLTVSVVGGTGVRTQLGPITDRAVETNAALPGRSRWTADYRLKAAAWEALRRHMPAPGSADIVLCNRGPLSQLVYSAVSGAPELLDTEPTRLEQSARPRDTHLLLSCPDDVVAARAHRRASVGDKPLRTLDTPEFIARANRAYHDLATYVPWVRVVEVSGGREENFATIMAVVDSVLPHDADRGGEDAA
ncbi:hypothetical protein [Myceligenerans crystallogenes]|uniref:Thymidylate kinase n=1 Tax=Myceligenerans crystallogenes TaxID=316335 RepID=A0ABN2N9H3_9MICO